MANNADMRESVIAYLTERHGNEWFQVIDRMLLTVLRENDLFVEGISVW